MGILCVKFQTNDKPWSKSFLMDDVDREWRRRLKPFLGELRLKLRGQTPGPYRNRDITISRAVKLVENQTHEGLTCFVENTHAKGVRVHVFESAHPFGTVYHTEGPCTDDYDNIVFDHNAAGQLVKLQRPAMLAYHEAERLNGHPIRITGIGWRSCSEQTALHNSDPNRFADSAGSRHCRGLAIDVYNTADNLTFGAQSTLESVGFCFGVTGEPWHCAYTECG